MQYGWRYGAYLVLEGLGIAPSASMTLHGKLERKESAESNGLDTFLAGAKPNLRAPG